MLFFDKENKVQYEDPAGPYVTITTYCFSTTISKDLAFDYPLKAFGLKQAFYLAT